MSTRNIDFERLFRESDQHTVAWWCQEFDTYREALYARGRPPKGFRSISRVRHRLQEHADELTAPEWAERCCVTVDHVYNMAARLGVKTKRQQPQQAAA